MFAEGRKEARRQAWYAGGPAALRQTPLGRWFFSDRPRAGLTFEKKFQESNVTNGTITRLISERGFGFISGQDGKEYFFHRAGVAPSVDFDRLVGGEAVTFEVEAGPKGPRAIQVQMA